MAAIDKGTIAAVVPMEVPATSRVKGMSATSRMMKGNERKPFTTAPVTRLRESAGTSPPRSVTTSSTPRGRPSSRVARLAAPTMVRVSTAESMKSSMSRGDMAENLHVGCAVAQESDDRSEEHTSELQSLMRNSYAVFCLKNKNNIKNHLHNNEAATT